MSSELDEMVQRDLSEMEDPTNRRSALRRIASGMIGAAALPYALAGCGTGDALGPNPDPTDCTGGDCDPEPVPCPDLVLEVLNICDPDAGYDAFDFSLEPGTNMPGIDEIETARANLDTCGLLVPVFGQPVQRTEVLYIAGLQGSSSARRTYSHLVGDAVEINIFPKTESGEGSFLLSVNGVAVPNAATQFEYNIKGGAPQTHDALNNGILRVLIDYEGQQANSQITKNGRFDIPEDRRVKEMDLLELYAVR